MAKVKFLEKLDSFVGLKIIGRELETWNYGAVVREVASRRRATLMLNSKVSGRAMKRIKWGFKCFDNCLIPGSFKSMTCDGQYVCDIGEPLIDPVDGVLQAGYYIDLDGTVWQVSVVAASAVDDMVTELEAVPLASGLDQLFAVGVRVTAETVQYFGYRDGLGLEMMTSSQVCMPYIGGEHMSELNNVRKVCDIVFECLYQEWAQFVGTERLRLDRECYGGSVATWHRKQSEGSRWIHGYRNGDCLDNSVYNIMFLQERNGFWCSSDYDRWINMREQHYSSRSICEVEGWIQLNAPLKALTSFDSTKGLKFEPSVDVCHKLYEVSGATGRGRMRNDWNLVFKDGVWTLVDRRIKM